MSNKSLIVLALVALCGFAPLMSPLPGSGLAGGEAIAPYLNGVFPSTPPFGAVGFDSAFSSLTFNSALVWEMHPHYDTVFVGQRDGLISWIHLTDTATVKNTFLDLRPNVGVVWDGGFLGMAMHPDFGVSGALGRNYFYVYYCSRDGNGGNAPTTPLAQPCQNGSVWNGGYNYLCRYSVFDGTLTVDPSSRLEMFKVRHYNSTHYGGGMVFGNDGFLYLTLGEQAQHEPAQNISQHLDGAVHRVDVNMDPSKSHAPVYTHPQDPRGPEEFSGVGYYIPNDNPFVGQPGVFEEYYSMGHRNPHRMTKDKSTGLLYIGEIGSVLHEEVNVVSAGKNYGWPVYEGDVLTSTCASTMYNNMPHELPLVIFPRAEANSIIGGYVYRGNDLPQLFGKYLCADYGFGEEIWSVDTQTGTYETVANHTPSGEVISFGQDHDGEIYLLVEGSNLPIYKLAAQNANANLPDSLSAVGAFSDLPTLDPANGVIPYEMIEPFWSDRAKKRRFMAVPNDGTHDTPAEQVTYSENGIWEFPVGSVIIKHFDLPTDLSDPSQTIRLETRFIVIYDVGKAYWLTYKWRPDGSDADLLSGSLEETIPITTPNGTVDQVWHYPGRSECFSCHNEKSKGTLGTSTRNLNTDFTYPSTGITANQLVTLSAIGLLNASITDADTPSLLTHKMIDDVTASLEDRARSYLDLNCAYCHQPGTGNRAVFDARMSTPLLATNLFSSQLNESLGIPGEAIVKPFDTATSVLYQRIHTTGYFAMPPLAKGLIDERGSRLIADWIMNLDTLQGICQEYVFDFNNLLPYGGQDNGVATVLSNGSELLIEDNAWKAVPFDYMITENTLLDFEFRSNEEAEMHVIGFDENLTEDQSKAFNLYGTQTYGIEDYKTYTGSGSWEHYQIPVGQYFTGPISYMFFNCDNDASPTVGESGFRHVRVFEDVNADGLCDETGDYVAVAPKVFLEGAYDGGQLNDDLRVNSYIPMTEPYSSIYPLVNAGGENTVPSMLDTLHSNRAVDWILIELRDGNDSTAVVTSKPGLLFADGTVQSATGGPVKLAASPGEYFVVIRHRNHLGVMTNGSYGLGYEPTTIDFTDPALPLYGQSPTRIVNGVRLLWTGDVTADGKLKYIGSNNDRDAILLRIGGSIPTNVISGYYSEDVNLDGEVKYVGTQNDRDQVLLNIGGSSVTVIRTEQLP
jgi:uncharacterized repeat protein (TIGR03806 family)